MRNNPVAFSCSVHCSKVILTHMYHIGKLCLQHVDMVEKSVVQMAMELEKCEHSVIRNNIIVVLCDLMVR